MHQWADDCTQGHQPQAAQAPEMHRQNSTTFSTRVTRVHVAFCGLGLRGKGWWRPGEQKPNATGRACAQNCRPWQQRSVERSSPLTFLGRSAALYMSTTFGSSFLMSGLTGSARATTARPRAGVEIRRGRMVVSEKFMVCRGLFSGSEMQMCQRQDACRIRAAGQCSGC